MAEEEARSDTDPNETGDSSSSEEVETNNDDGGDDGITEYEKQRLARIKENKARLESLGLPALASSFFGSVEKRTKRKGKEKKNDKDDEYTPSDGEDRVSSSSDEGGEEEDEGEEFQVKNKRKGKSPMSKSGSKKKVPVKNLASQLDFVDDDEALQQAIALSLGDSLEVSAAVLGGLPQNFRTDTFDFDSKERKKDRIGQKNNRGRKRRKSNTSLVQMTEDQVVIHFFHFDETGKGNITLKDLERVASAHNFTWTDKEMADMIYCFDSDRDGQLNLKDFREILNRLNMIQGAENAST